MNFFEFNNIRPQLGQNSYVAPTAVLIGNVQLGDDASIWFHTVARGDIEPIKVGAETNIQDLCMMHTSKNFPLTIGAQVSVGHSVTLHACTVEDNCLIGMGSTLLDGSVIGKNSLVAANSLVPPGKKFPPYSFIMGSPAKVIRPLTEEEKKTYGNHYQSYILAKNSYLEGQCVPYRP